MKVCERVFLFNHVRWSCRCGRFVGLGDICQRDYRDETTFYGISTETHYHCSRCGFVDDEPRTVMTGVGVVSI